MLIDHSPLPAPFLEDSIKVTSSELGIKKA